MWLKSLPALHPNLFPAMKLNEVDLRAETERVPVEVVSLGIKTIWKTLQ
jgi:hypothetical protein